MKNIEKYTNTKDALDAYNKLNSRELFETWLELEFEETREQSLLEAAEAVIDEWYHPQQNATCLNDLCEKIVDLKKAVEREKRKPIRNCDKYNTPEDASKAFGLMCENMTCARCPYNQGSAFRCKFAWLYDKAGKEERNEQR